MAELEERNIQQKVLTLTEVSNYLRVHPSTIYRMLKRGKLPAFKVGSDWRFNVEAIDRWRADMETGLNNSFRQNGNN